jgi:hypothetical protein
VQKPTEIVTSLIDRWNVGGTVPTNKSASAFGGSLLASEYIDDWADEAVSGTTWQHTLQIDSSTPLGGAVDAVTQGVPLMVTLNPVNSTVQFIGYPTAVRTPTELRYLDSAGNRVKFHPNIPHPDTADYFKPYSIRNLSCRLNLESVYNDFTVRYWEFAPTRETGYTLSISRTSSSVWNGTAFTTDTTRESECQDSFDRWGHRPLTIELRGIHNHATAQGALDYLFVKGIAPLMLVTAEAHLEAYDLAPGKLVQFSNDCAKVFEPPRYDLTAGSAPLIDWEDFEFFVLDIELLPEDSGITVRFLCEEKAV